jgi:8-oxo-dGTP diphosphatase
MSMSDAPIHVVAGILRDTAGRVLLAQRPPGKHLAGHWEFPGGKVEPGESTLDALARELEEEIGITVESARPLIAVPWTYTEKRIVLHAWEVERHRGDVTAREAQALRWTSIDTLASLPMPAADRPIVDALRLPDRYLITPTLDVTSKNALLDGIERACRAGIRLIQLREPTWPASAIADIAIEARDICRTHGARLLLHADVALAEQLDLDGAHLPARVAASLDARPIDASRWLGVSCHDARELAHAARIGANFATLSPLAPTPSHPDAAPLGWPRFAELVADVPMPVYALGGVAASDIDAARDHGGQGIAAIRGFWR